MSRVLYMMLAALPVLGQTVFVSSGSGAPGETAVLDVSFANPGPEITALQFDINIPARYLAPAGEPAAGNAVRASGKALHCSGSWKKATYFYCYRCIVAGGAARLHNGTMAVIPLKVSPNARLGAYRIHTDHIVAVDRKVSRFELRRAEGVLNVLRTGAVVQ